MFPSSGQSKAKSPVFSPQASLNISMYKEEKRLTHSSRYLRTFRPTDLKFGLHVPLMFSFILTSLWPPPAKKSAPCACSESWVHFRENFTKQKRDEAHFWLNGYVNKQNCRIWSEANPQVYAETPLHPEKLTVWCALWAGGILLQKR
ncbi:hypothetical protein TNCV_1569471 [Trichonephila clavipes]|uniref:Uncharacterized protein n=1 Tax=Trichonephila clavipes TaxID=2585209 RepID=A0A8X6STR7_TRICX|nr:hypothetical protein TNCV_1569471 [Trichonephila clavipes]